MHHTWKLLTIIFIVAIIGLGIAAANDPNLKARFDAIFRGALNQTVQNTTHEENSTNETK